MRSLFGNAKGANLIEYAVLVCVVGMISIGVFSGNIAALTTILHTTQDVMEQASSSNGPKQPNERDLAAKSSQPEEWRRWAAGVFLVLVVSMACIGVYIIWSTRP